MAAQLNSIEENGNHPTFQKKYKLHQSKHIVFTSWLTCLLSFNTQQRSMPLDPPKLHSGSDLLTICGFCGSGNWQRWKWMVDSAGLRQKLYFTEQKVTQTNRFWYSENTVDDRLLAKHHKGEMKSLPFLSPSGQVCQFVAILGFLQSDWRINNNIPCSSLYHGTANSRPNRVQCTVCPQRL